MFDLIKDVFGYLRHPKIVSIPNRIANPAALMLNLAVLCLAAGMFGGVLLGILIGLKVLPPPGPSLMEQMDMPKIMLIVGPLLLGPVTEELIFRAQLRRFTGNLLFLSLIPGFLLSQFTGTNWSFLISPLFFVVFFMGYRFTLAWSVTKKFTWWQKAFPWHFHLTSLCFALVHLGNFEKGFTLLPWGLLYTLPQWAAGLIFGYTRMNYGLKYAILLHAMYNAIPVLLLILKD